MEQIDDYVSYFQTEQECTVAADYVFPRLTQNPVHVLCSSTENYKENIPEETKGNLQPWLEKHGITKNEKPNIST